jgi:hypothetical protein
MITATATGAEKMDNLFLRKELFMALLWQKEERRAWLICIFLIRANQLNFFHLLKAKKTGLKMALIIQQDEKRSDRSMDTLRAETYAPLVKSLACYFLQKVPFILVIHYVCRLCFFPGDGFE